MPVIPAGAPSVTVQRVCSYCKIERLGSSADAWEPRLMPVATSRVCVAFLSSVAVDLAVANRPPPTLSSNRQLAVVMDSRFNQRLNRLQLKRDFRRFRLPTSPNTALQSQRAFGHYTQA